jgi:hypothetical protein
MAKIEKRFQTVLIVPKVWSSLLEIQSFDDVGAFLERRPPPEASGLQVMTKADYPRPIQHDHREVSFAEDDCIVCLDLVSGTENYYTVGSIVLPTGERYAQPEVSYEVARKVTLEILGLAKFTWQQKLG